MENKVEKYVHDEFGELEVMQVGDKFWFPATKCAEILGYSNPHAAVIRHCVGDGLTKREVVSLTTNQHGTTTEQKVAVNYIDEGNLYRLIIRSKLPDAQAFEHWVFDTVLPTIRKHGAYIIPELLDELQRNTIKNAELLKDLANEQRERIAVEERYRNLEYENKQLATASKLLEETLEEVKPKISYYDTILQNPAAVPVTLIAKDYGMPAIRFNRLLHGFHIQFPVG
ncbi:MAG: phage antirepressor KilAC domain-containing protein [Clostridia bacterium]|nr:phage antirepressor KilAC domain-containing protein [Clostridia bacterium]